MVARPFQRFQWPVPRDVVDRVCTQIAATGEPEGIAELHHGPISKDEPFLIIREISIPRDRRGDGGKAPCPMCQPNKFLDGRLVWFTQLEAIAAIGHCCAGRETRLAAEREYRAREAKARAEEYLLQILPGLQGFRAERAKLEPRAAAAQAVFDQFRGAGASFQRALRQAIKGSGVLSVTEVLGPRLKGGPSGMLTAGSTVETRDVNFGVLAGPAAVATHCHLVEELREAERLLERFPSISGDDAVLDFLAELDDAELLSCATTLRNVQKKVVEVRSRLDELVTFFTTANAARITAWGSHPDAPLRMRANCRASRLAGQVEFEILGGQGRRVGLLLPPAFWPDGQRPSSL